MPPNTRQIYQIQAPRCWDFKRGSSSFTFALLSKEHKYVFQCFFQFNLSDMVSAADAKMEIPALVRSLKSSIYCSTSSQLDDTLWEWCLLLWSNLGIKPIWLLSRTEHLGLGAYSSIPPNQRNNSLFINN